jgi:hypothetical protein
MPDITVNITPDDTFPNDKSHFHSVYNQIHRLAAEHPNETINLAYIGGVVDGHLDLQNLINCFAKHPHLLPKNVKFTLSDGTKNKASPEPFNIMICGTGGIDRNPGNTLSQLFPSLPAKIDVANELYRKTTEQLILQRDEVMPGVDVSLLDDVSVPIRTRDG